MAGGRHAPMLLQARLRPPSPCTHPCAHLMPQCSCRNGHTRARSGWPTCNERAAVHASPRRIIGRPPWPASNPRRPAHFDAISRVACGHIPPIDYPCTAGLQSISVPHSPHTQLHCALAQTKSLRPESSHSMHKHLICGQSDLCPEF